ncbi:hypothetical protein PIB30_079720 [Stylosanthes scabra]|uniref:Uncharacterized protein n=1 Tax=Stylosanthes scabra TaxID=79078 RepID=A0ABU6ZQ30_9FABA|nr:hypothetical protein [Stylosanthes scabra]
MMTTTSSKFVSARSQANFVAYLRRTDVERDPRQTAAQQRGRDLQAETRRGDGGWPLIRDGETSLQGGGGCSSEKTIWSDGGEKRRGDELRRRLCWGKLG